MHKNNWAFLIIIDIEGDSIDEIFLKNLQLLLKKNNGYYKNSFFSVCVRCNLNTLNKIIGQNSNLVGSQSPPDYALYFFTSDTGYEKLDCNISTAIGIEFLIKKSFNNVPNIAHFGLITFGHGGGYSFFNNLENDSKPALNQNILINIDFDKKLIRPEITENTDKYLDMEELALGVKGGLQQITKNKKLALLLMSHCSMAYFDTARKMQLCTNYWLAAINNYDVNAINFSSFFDKFETKESVENLVRNCVPKPDEKNETSVVNFWKDTSTMLCYDLRVFPKLKKLFYLLIKQFLKYQHFNFPKIAKARQDLVPTQLNYLLVDFFDFIENLQKQYHKNTTVFKICRQIIGLTLPLESDNFGISIYKDKALDKIKQNLNLFFPKDKDSFLSFFKDDTSRASISLDSLNNKVLRPKWEYFIILFFNK